MGRLLAGEPRRLTPTQLSTRLACAHYTQLERKRRAGDLEVEFMPDPRLEAMRARGARHEHAYIERLRQAGSSIVDLRESRDARATLATMREGAQVIVQAPLGNDDFAGIADVLLRVEVPSALGDTPFAGAGLFLVEVPHEGNQSRFNEEIDAVARIVRHLLAGTQWTDHEGRTRPLEPSDIVVVAPYNVQVSALRRTLAPLGVTRVGTVDKFQGQEAAIVIYSCTASSPQDARAASPSSTTCTASTWRPAGRAAPSSSSPAPRYSSRTAGRRSRCGGRMGFAITRKSRRR